MLFVGLLVHSPLKVKRITCVSKPKTNVITLTNHSGRNQRNEPTRISLEFGPKTAPRAGKLVQGCLLFTEKTSPGKPILFQAGRNVLLRVPMIGGEQGWRSGESTPSHQCGPCLIPQVDAIMWVAFVVCSCPYLEGFSTGTPVFFPPQNPTFSNSNSIRKIWTPSKERLHLFYARFPGIHYRSVLCFLVPTF